MKRLIGFAVLAALATPAMAEGVNGVWLRDNGKSKVRIAPCGEMLCGNVVWLKDTSGPSKIGMRIFYGMKATGANSWAGQAFNPEDGKTYSGKMSVSGDTLSTSGCVLGGLICKSVSWSRSNL